jgi:hypothetical protein
MHSLVGGESANAVIDADVLSFDILGFERGK